MNYTYNQGATVNALVCPFLLVQLVQRLAWFMPTTEEHRLLNSLSLVLLSKASRSVNYDNLNIITPLSS